MKLPPPPCAVLLVLTTGMCRILAMENLEGTSAHDRKSGATEAAHLLGVRGPEGEILRFWKLVF